MIEQNVSIPDFDFSATNNLAKNIKDYRGQKVVLYFYPKDNTPGCTLECKAFRDLAEKFADSNVVIFGVSRDSLLSHEKFKAKLKLPFELIADTDSKVCEIFDVIQSKSLFGKKYLGIERSTFVIDTEGVVRGIWRKVKILGHAEEVYNSVKHLTS